MKGLMKTQPAKEMTGKSHHLGMSWFLSDASGDLSFQIATGLRCRSPLNRLPKSVFSVQSRVEQQQFMKSGYSNTSSRTPP